MVKTNIKYLVLTLLFFFILFGILLFKSIDNQIFTLGADSSSYLSPAISFSENFSFVDVDGRNMHNNTPLYSIFISIFYKLFDQDNYQILIQMIQIVFLFLIAFISLKVDLNFTPKQKIFLFVLILANPNFFSNAYFAQSEIFFTLFFILSIIYATKFLNNSDDLKNSFFSIFFMLIALNVRPIGQYYLVMIFLIFNFNLLLTKINFKKVISFNLLSLILIIFLTSPWMIRNKYEFNEFFITSNKGYYALDNLSNLIKISENISDDQAYQKALNLNLDLINEKGEVEKHYCFQKKHLRSLECVDIVFNSSMKNIYKYDKFQTFKSLSYSFINTYFSGGSSNLKLIFFGENNSFWKEKIDRGYLKNILSFNFFSQTIFFACLFFSILLKIFTIRGLIALFKENKFIFIFYLLIFVLSTLLFMFVGNSRFRVPLEPIFAIITVYGLNKYLLK